MTRPTTAQLATSDRLADLADLADLVRPLAVLPSDAELCREVRQAATALIALVDGTEAWIGPAVAFDAEATLALGRVLTRSALR